MALTNYDQAVEYSKNYKCCYCGGMVVVGKTVSVAHKADCPRLQYLRELHCLIRGLRMSLTDGI